MDLRLDNCSAESSAYFELSASREGWCCLARMARISVRSRSLKRSGAGRALGAQRRRVARVERRCSLAWRRGSTMWPRTAANSLRASWARRSAPCCSLEEMGVGIEGHARACVAEDASDLRDVKADID